VSVQNATGAPQRVNGHMVASDRPGLGVELNMGALGEAVAEYTT
jgi:L-alanine-DL-glutamate epimerase-like enolase superfamily enzyme